MLKSPDTIGELLMRGATICPPMRAPIVPMTIEMSVPRCALMPISLTPAQPITAPARSHRTMFTSHLQGNGPPYGGGCGESRHLMDGVAHCLYNDRVGSQAAA